MKLLLPLLYVIVFIALSQGKSTTELKDEELDVDFEGQQDLHKEDNQKEFHDNEIDDDNEIEDNYYNENIEESEQDLLDNEIEDEDNDDTDEELLSKLNQDQEDSQDMRTERPKRVVGALLRLLRLGLRGAGRGRGRGRGRRPNQRCPTIRFPCRSMPNVCANIRNAFRMGKPRTLTRITFGSQIRRNRRLSGCRQLGRRSGYNCDEYPFASSLQGGRGAVVRLVPIRENSMQGGLLSVFYRRHRIGHGGCFRVSV